MKKLGLCVFIFISFLLSSCGNTIIEERFDNVVGVFWHENVRYSLQIQEPGSSEIKTVSFVDLICRESEDMNLSHQDVKDKRVKILADVPPDKSMWAYKKTKYDTWNGNCFLKMEIHIHSKDDIQGGGWNHGKFGRGQTVKIE